MSQFKAEFANFLCHFGTKKVLLDYLDTIVIPMFVDDTLVRKYGREHPKHYHFYNVSLELLNNDKAHPIIGIFGEFVKDINLVRTQVFGKNGLVQDKRSMLSSPSAYFLLLLHNHQLIYLPKTSHAPTLKEFESTVRSFAKAKHSDFIKAMHKDAKDAGKKVKQASLKLKHPAPVIDIVQLTDNQNIANFIKRFEKLNSISFKILKPNPVIKGDEVFAGLIQTMETLNSNNTTLNTSNTTDGLNKSAAAKVISDAATGGNHSVSLKGYTEEGAEIKGSNEDFKFSVDVPELPGTDRGTAKIMYDAFCRVAPAPTSYADLSAEAKSLLKKIATDL